MTERRSLSPKLRLVLFERAGGRCHICGRPIRVGEAWDMEHIVPLGLGGADNPSNLGPAHKACHAPKTAEDVAAIARAKRRKAKHLGIKQRSTFPKLPPGYRYNWRLGRPVKETA